MIRVFLSGSSGQALGTLAGTGPVGAAAGAPFNMYLYTCKQLSGLPLYFFL